ncbi:pantoate--beta-alanine ligase [Tuberibacillus sp. Marseille-P3662]|uniref:pantoate--beta-alanine ligase n=1 Tax=Tuberibacillus sp. Marseille-P3662 TaxID=1965358 RepID=UPI000A1CDF9C|nr:pantoate--beta-alanine ligase [Tuberibacillus sp. Marseille-P3662]
MKVVTTPREYQSLIADYQNEGQSIAFVPTMGFLHEGHLSLIDKAKKKSDIVVMSIFVNPTQFGPNEDFDSYPRNLSRDKVLAEQYGVHIVFIPKVEDMYPNNRMFMVNVLDRVDVLCGASRPGHFDGVATVLLKLFNIIRPDTAFFGMKDAQQLAVVKGLVESFHMPVTVVGCPTVREADGLAKSSRNVRLTDIERTEAVHIFKVLEKAKHDYEQGVLAIQSIQSTVLNELNRYIKNGSIDYVEVYTYPELNFQFETANQMIIAVAIQYSQARLIDNVVIEL